uniref:DUF805 domain-containing protein n=1 Tax=Bradyrhizobium septentrionale TaxID=1404411 RepID=A0A973VU98_9BRAD
MQATASIATCFRKFADFSGRAPRAEFWWFFGFCLLVLLAAHQLDTAIYVAIAMALPMLAVTARRFHDSGLTTGLAVFFAVAPFAIFYFFAAIQDRVEAWFGVHVPYGLIAAIPAICAFAFSGFCFLAALARRSQPAATTARTGPALVHREPFRLMRPWARGRRRNARSPVFPKPSWPYSPSRRMAGHRPSRTRPTLASPPRATSSSISARVTGTASPRRLSTRCCQGPGRDLKPPAGA